MKEVSLTLEDMPLEPVTAMYGMRDITCTLNIDANAYKLE
jgi:hypothetical protein